MPLDSEASVPKLLTNTAYKVKFLSALIARVPFAEVAELVDALGSGLSGCMPVRVRVPPSAPL